MPVDLARTLIAPHVLKDGTTYLTERGYEVVSGFGTDAQRARSRRASTGRRSPTAARRFLFASIPARPTRWAQIKFGLAAGTGIYLHDTPNKELFAKAERNLSNGCVRLEDAPRFARWLLGDELALEQRRRPSSRSACRAPCRSPSLTST